MINKEQVQLGLLAEIDEICTKNDIKYVIYPVDGINSIAMTKGDALKLKEIIDNEKYNDRFWESINENEDLQFWGIMYGHSNTCSFEVIKSRTRQNKGIYVEIFFIEKAYDRKGNKKLKILDLLRVISSYRSKQWSLWFIKISSILSTIVGRTRIKNIYLKLREKYALNCWDEIYKLKTVQIGEVVIDTSYFTRISKVSFGEYSFMAPENYDMYLKQLYSKKDNWGDKPASRELVSGSISYKELYEDEEFAEMMKQTHKYYEKYVSIKKNNIFGRRHVKRLWDIVLITMEKVELERNIIEIKNENEKASLNRKITRFNEKCMSKNIAYRVSTK